jgi:hypothetical protein
MDDGIYIPVSDRTLRKLDQLVSIFAGSGDAPVRERQLSRAASYRCLPVWAHGCGRPAGTRGV